MVSSRRTPDKLLLAISLIFLLPLFSFSQINSKDTSVTADHVPVSEVVVGIPGLTAEEWQNIRTKLKSLNGVSYAGYCDDQECFGLRISGNPDGSHKLVSDAVLEVKPDARLYFKTCTIAGLLGRCRDKAKFQFK